MDISKLNKQFELFLSKQLSDTAYILYKDIESSLQFYLEDVTDDKEQDIWKLIDSHLNKILKNKLIVSLEHYIEQKANLAALEDEESQKEYPVLSQSQEFEDSELTKI